MASGAAPAIGAMPIMPAISILSICIIAMPPAGIAAMGAAAGMEPPGIGIILSIMPIIMPIIAIIPPDEGAAGGLMLAIAGAGNVGLFIANDLIGAGHEVQLIEQNPSVVERSHADDGVEWLTADACEVASLRKAGLERCDVVVAATGDDEDNLVISQIAKEGFGVRKAIARVNNPRNQQHFDLLGITQTVCATTSILGLVEHEMPEHGLVRLLELQQEGLVIAEVQVEGGSPAAGKRVGGLGIPSGARLISVFRQGRTELVEPSTVMRPGDQVLAIVPKAAVPELRRALLGAK